MSIKIIPYEEKYLNQLLDFFRKNSPDHPELFEKDIFLWQNSKRYLALLNNEIVGHISQITQSFKYNNEVIDLGWATTLVLDSSNPVIQLFAGTELLNCLANQKNIKFGAVGVVPEIVNSHKRRGYLINTKSSKMYARFSKPKKALSYLNKPENLSTIIQLGNYFTRPFKDYGKHRVKEIQRFISEWDPIWDKYLSNQYCMYSERNAEFLNYKLQQPKKNYQSYVYKGENGLIQGYIIFRKAVNNYKNISLLKVCDIVGSYSARKTLLSYAVDFYEHSSLDGIIALSSKTERKLFFSCGIWISKSYPVVLHPDIDNPVHITFFDSDLDHLW